MNLIKTAANTTTGIAKRMIFKAKKISPELLIVGGVVCVVGGTVMACRATLKAHDILEEHNEQIEEVKPANDPDQEVMDDVIPTDQETKKLVRKTYANTVWKLTKAYAPAITVTTLGLSMIFTSHGIMKKRNATLLAAYNTIDMAYRKYRERVIEDQGKDKDLEYALGRRNRDFTYLTDENGNVQETKMNGYVFDDISDPYTFEFNQYTSNRFSVKYPLSNLNTIREVEDWATIELRTRGYIFLNEVLERFGMEPVAHGQLVGWVMHDKFPNAPEHCDEFVDTRAIEGYTRDAAILDQDTFKKTIVLNFNCDGEIFRLLDYGKALGY